MISISAAWGRGLAAGFPVCIGNYHKAAVDTGWVIIIGAWSDVAEVTLEAGKSPI